MGKSSTAATNRYKRKAYDRYLMLFPKGSLEEIKAHIEKSGESVRGYVLRLIREDMDK